MKIVGEELVGEVADEAFCVADENGGCSVEFDEGEVSSGPCLS
jgi:hypothetical protein